MPERIQAILNKVVAWWKKFNTKQRTLMISAVAVVIVAKLTNKKNIRSIWRISLRIIWKNKNILRRQVWISPCLIRMARF